MDIVAEIIVRIDVLTLLRALGKNTPFFGNQSRGGFTMRSRLLALAAAAVLIVPVFACGRGRTTDEIVIGEYGDRKSVV